MDSLEWYKYYRANEYGTKSDELKLAAVDNIVKEIIGEISESPSMLERSPFLMEVKGILERKAALSFLNWSRQAIDLMDASLIISSVWEVLQDPEYSVRQRRYDARSWVFTLNHRVLEQQQKTHEDILQRTLVSLKNWVTEQNKPKPIEKPVENTPPPSPQIAPPPVSPVAAAAYKPQTPGESAARPAATSSAQRPPVGGSSSRRVPPPSSRPAPVASDQPPEDDYAEQNMDAARAAAQRPAAGSSSRRPPVGGSSSRRVPPPSSRSASAATDLPPEDDYAEQNMDAARTAAQRPAVGSSSRRPPVSAGASRVPAAHPPGQAPGASARPTPPGAARPAVGSSSRRPPVSAGASRVPGAAPPGSSARPGSSAAANANAAANRRAAGKTTSAGEMTERLNNIQTDLQNLVMDFQSYNDNLLRQAAMGQIELLHRISRIYEQHISIAEESNNPDYLDAVQSQREYMDFISDRLTNMGVVKISSKPGTPFDGRFHEPAVSGKPTPRGAVIRRSISPGFRFNDTVWQKEKVEI